VSIQEIGYDSPDVKRQMHLHCLTEGFGTAMLENPIPLPSVFEQGDRDEL
jgi:hypothetical protein